MDAATIEKEAMNLSEAERALLADRLLQTLGSEDAHRIAKWAEEGDRRQSAVEAGDLKTDDNSSVVARLRQ